MSTQECQNLKKKKLMVWKCIYSGRLQKNSACYAAGFMI